jgi:putative DNA-invertase from lambdoid prophage Rac
MECEPVPGRVEGSAWSTMRGASASCNQLTARRPTDSRTTNGISGLILRVMTAFAQWERKRTAERITDAKRVERARGQFQGRHGKDTDGKPLYRLIEHPTEQAAIRRMRELKAGEEHGLRQIPAAVSAGCGLKVSHVLVKNVLERGNAT